jgi:hypothetical protein
MSFNQPIRDALHQKAILNKFSINILPTTISKKRKKNDGNKKDKGNEVLEINNNNMINELEIESNNNDYVDNNDEECGEHFDYLSDGNDSKIGDDDGGGESDDYGMTNHNEESDNDNDAIDNNNDVILDQRKMTFSSQFNIISQSIIAYQNTSNIPTDSNTLFCSKQNNQLYTKGNFSRDFKNWSCTAGLKDQDALDLLKLLHKYIPETCINLPLKIEQKGRVIVDETKKYILCDKRILSFDICSKGCMAFVGEDNETKYCGICGFNRFRDCLNYNCKINMSNGNKLDICSHSNRIPGYY